MSRADHSLIKYPTLCAALDEGTMRARGGEVKLSRVFEGSTEDYLTRQPCAVRRAYIVTPRTRCRIRRRVCT